MMSGRGGSETAVAGLVQGLLSGGDETHIYLFGGLPRDPRWLKGLHYTVLGSPTETRLRRLIKYTFGLAGEFKQFRPDVVVALDPPRLLKGRVALALSRIKSPLWSWIHFPIEYIKMKRLMKLADGHLAISDGVGRQIKRLVGGSGAEHVVTIYNAIPMDGERVTRPAGRDTVEFLHVGRLEFAAQKRVADLLAAAARLKGNFRLTIIGDGDDRDRLEQYSRDLGIGDRITWLGWRDAPWEHVTKASLLLLTSSYEGFGIVLVEALSRGIPCITSKCNYGPDEIIEHGRNGWLYPVGDIEQLAQLMQAVIDDPQILPSQESTAASAQKFSTRAVTERAKLAFASLNDRSKAFEAHPQPGSNLSKNQQN
jgi:UDP-D-galactose:(glucosyl)LPS alpha-1,6-D-galactosyltransferase